MKTYSTSEVAALVGLHPNTIRRYEEWELIPIPPRANNGYRVFTDYHVETIKIAQIAFQIEVLQSGLRMIMVDMVKAVARYDFTEAQALLDRYLQLVDQEISNAHEVIKVVENLLAGRLEEEDLFLTRSETAEYLGVTSEALRNWERNGLLAIKRSKNNYRVYDAEDIKRLKIIRTLRSAKYSLAAILRMLNAIDQEKQDIKTLLNPTDPDDSILTACDNLIDSLEKAKDNAGELKQRVKEMQNLFFN
ncbi:MerR family transcriptional regulator [Enterococcus sp. AZ196]|uniref:MerR family transcriptional regulator n=1 Tax=Enterococcus sp. AZ196 TaxID=2774659 RepID=UPI003D29F890